MTSLQKNSTSSDATGGHLLLFAVTLFGLLGSVCLMGVNPLLGAICLFLTLASVVGIAHMLPTPPTSREPEMSWETLERQLAEMVEYPSTLGDKKNMLALVRRIAKSGQQVKNPKTIGMLLLLTQTAPAGISEHVAARRDRRAHERACDAMVSAHGLVVARNKVEQEKTPADDGALVAC